VTAPAGTATVGTVYLADANILLRLMQPEHPHHVLTRAALGTLRSRGDRVVTTSQSLYEFWTVATRPSVDNGLGKTPAQVGAWLSFFEQHLPPLPELPLYVEWKRLATDYNVQGKQGHDARLVAAMKVHGITHLLTFNAAHFRRFEAGEGIMVVEPQSLSTGAPLPSTAPLLPPIG
jgi:predicted nucleic acid-binding protein